LLVLGLAGTSTIIQYFHCCSQIINCSRECGAGIIIYAALNPGQKVRCCLALKVATMFIQLCPSHLVLQIFNVPDAVIPPITTPTPSSTP
jgi:hypothetical protein